MRRRGLTERPERWELNHSNSLSRDLLAFYGGRFSGGADVHDSSIGGELRRGTLTVGAGDYHAAKWLRAIGRNVLAFDAVNDVVVLPADRLEPACTLSAWIYPRSYGGGNLGRVFDGTQTFWFFASTLMTFTSNAASNIVQGATPIPLNVWSHIAVVRSNTTSVLFLNGEANSSATATGTVTANSNLRIGGRASDSTRQFDGYIGDFCAFNAALSSGDIRSLASSDPMYGDWILPPRRKVFAAAVAPPTYNRRRRLLIGA